MATELDAPPKSVAGGDELEVDKIFRQLIKHEGSDLHMQVGKAPILRVKGTLRELQMESIDREHINVELGKEDPGGWLKSDGGMMKQEVIQITLPLSTPLADWLPALKAGLEALTAGDIS